MNTPDPSPSQPLAKYRLPLAIGGGVLVIVVAAIALLRPPPTPVAQDTMTSADVASGRAWKDKQPLTVDELLSAGVWLDVPRPAALKTVLTENAWLTATADEPLGRGFLGGWAGLLGTTGEDVGLQKLTTGVVGALIADAVLVQPMRLAFFSGWGGSTPALIIPRPEAPLSATFATIKAAVERGGHFIEACPGEPAPAPTPDGQADAGTAPVNPNRVDISRLVVADQPVFAALARDRLVFSKDATAVVHAVCGGQPDIASSPNADVVVGLAASKVGRDVHALFGLLGMKGAPSVAFKVDGQRLTPVGLAGALAQPGRLDTVAIPEATWGLVPEDLPVTVAANLRLPKSLSTSSLEAFYGGKDAGAVTRQALFLWQPRGDQREKTEVAVVWSDVADKEGLQDILSGPNRMEVRVVCNHLVASSTPALLARIEAACTQKAPALTFAQPAVVAGLKVPTSVGVVVDLGRLFSGLLDDGFALDPARPKAKKGEVPAEITAAKKRLLELPRIGLFGDKQGQALTPRGFSS